MGKKSKKTTWRNLPIEGQSDQQQCSSVTISDSEESHITVNSSQPYQHRQRYHDSPRYCRSDRTTASTRYSHSCNGYGDHACPRGSVRLDRRYDGTNGGVYRTGRGGGGSKVAVEGAGGKITFNEDEYTRITTPRQDVLFKKGYLNRPRPSMVTSTTDASAVDLATSESLLLTPDHQLITPDSSPFCYPTTTGYIARDGLYFFNGFESYPVVVYNTTPPQYCFNTTDLEPSSRSKRYSTDSMTESTTSPQTEEHSGGDGEASSFLPSLQAAATIQTPNVSIATRKTQIIPNANQETIDISSPLIGNTEQRKLKKKRRRKLSKPINKKPDESTTTSVSASEDEITTSTDTEEADGEDSKSSTPHIKEPAEEESPSTCPNSPQSGSSSTSSSSITTSCSPTEDTDRFATSSSLLKPDAKEFIPRQCNTNTSSSAVPIDYFNQTTQYQLIDPLGRPFLQPAFMPLPAIVLSPVGPSHYMVPPPFGHLPAQQHNDNTQMDTAETAQLKDAQQLTCIEAAVTKTAFDVSSNVQLEQPPVQNNFSKDGIEVIVAKLEEQENVLKIQRNNKRYTQQQKDGQFADKRSGIKNINASPNRSNNTNGSANNQSKTCAKDAVVQQRNNVTWPQRKPYNILLKPAIIENQREKSARLPKLNTSLKTSQTDIIKQTALVNRQNPATTKLSSPVACINVQSNSCPTVNPWINVSNRKKRRSNLTSSQQTEEQTCMEDVDYNAVPSERLEMKESTVTADVHNDDGFEQYDVDELVDVVVEKDLTSAEITTAVKQECVCVQDIEEKLDKVEDITTVVEKEPKEDVRIKQNKKSSNKNGKQTKRVMVIDNIQPVTTKDSPIKKMVEPNKIEANKTTVPKKEVAKTEITPKPSKTKSKKKSSLSNQTKPTSSTPDNKCVTAIEQLNCSPSSGSYNFIPSNSENKTNVEVSQELDVLIQRGMYSTLEEKIRSFNITASNDGFFRTINYYGTGKLNVDLTNSAGNKDLNGILKDLKPALKNTTFDLAKSTDALQITSAQCGNISNGYQDFLGSGPDPHEPDKDSASALEISSTATGLSREFSPVRCDGEMTYPITRAVKEWMTKTREHTPDVELLKSPTTILRQFAATCQAGDDADEDVTLWTLSNTDSVDADQDLLDCWEVEDVAEEAVRRSASLPIDGGHKEECFVEMELRMSTSVGQGDEKVSPELDGDEVLEVYENRYEKNEDFVRIRGEWEDRSKSGGKSSCSLRQHSQGNTNHHRAVIPSTASLPYRAICCVIM